MCTWPRWEAEKRMMHNNFPNFIAFVEPGGGAFGFRGKLRGPTTSEMYWVSMRALMAVYPNQEPAVYMRPHPEPHHWLADNRLCFRRDDRLWLPARDSFAQTLTIAAKYIDEFDGRG